MERGRTRRPRVPCQPGPEGDFAYTIRCSPYNKFHQRQRAMAVPPPGPGIWFHLVLYFHPASQTRLHCILMRSQGIWFHLVLYFHPASHTRPHCILMRSQPSPLRLAVRGHASLDRGAKIGQIQWSCIKQQRPLNVQAVAVSECKD